MSNTIVLRVISKAGRFLTHFNQLNEIGRSRIELPSTATFANLKQEVWTWTFYVKPNWWLVIESSECRWEISPDIRWWEVHEKNQCSRFRDNHTIGNQVCITQLGMTKCVLGTETWFILLIKTQCWPQWHRLNQRFNQKSLRKNPVMSKWSTLHLQKSLRIIPLALIWRRTSQLINQKQTKRSRRGTAIMDLTPNAWTA